MLSFSPPKNCSKTFALWIYEVTDFITLFTFDYIVIVVENKGQKVEKNGSGIYKWCTSWMPSFMLLISVLLIRCLLFAGLQNLRTSHNLTSGLWTSLSSLNYSTTLCQGLWRKPRNYLSYLRCPKLYCPVKRRGDKKMWEVYRSNCCMAVDTCDWSLVSFKHLTDSSFAVSEYTTKVNWFGNQTSADRDSTEMQFKYSHKKILLPCMDVTPLQKASPQQITEDLTWEQTLSSRCIFY